MYKAKICASIVKWCGITSIIHLFRNWIEIGKSNTLHAKLLNIININTVRNDWLTHSHTPQDKRTEWKWPFEWKLITWTLFLHLIDEVQFLGPDLNVHDSINGLAVPRVVHSSSIRITDLLTRIKSCNSRNSSRIQRPNCLANKLINRTIFDEIG